MRRWQLIVLTVCLLSRAALAQDMTSLNEGLAVTLRQWVYFYAFQIKYGNPAMQDGPCILRSSRGRCDEGLGEATRLIAGYERFLLNRVRQDFPAGVVTVVTDSSLSGLQSTLAANVAEANVIADLYRSAGAK